MKTRFLWLACALVIILVIAGICDQFTCECMALKVDGRLAAKDGVRVLAAAVAKRGSAPKFIRSDNSPESSRKPCATGLPARGSKPSKLI
jgi:hypothetical protein